MDINKINDFIENLNRTSTKLYLCKKENGKFGLTQEKSKRLSTREITKLAEEALGVLKEVGTNPEAQLNLQLGLKRYAIIRNSSTLRRIFFSKSNPFEHILNKLPRETLSIDKAKQFIGVLNAVSSINPAAYICKNKDGNYDITRDKSQRLNVEEVSLLAKETVEVLIHTPMPVEDRIILSQDLRGGVAKFVDERNSAILSRSFGRIALYFDSSNPLHRLLTELPTAEDILQSREKVLIQEAKDVEKLAQEENPPGIHAARLQAIAQELESIIHMDKLRKNLHAITALFLAKVVDQQNLYPKSLSEHGGSFSDSLPTLTMDLEEYAKEKASDDPDVSLALKELNKCQNLYVKIEHISHGTSFLHGGANAIFQELHNEITDLSKEDAPSRELIIPGGYGSSNDKSGGIKSGHAVIYRIKYDPLSKTYSFCLINTGEGVPIMRDPATKILKGFDIEYTNLKMEQLNPAFLKGLIDLQKVGIGEYKTKNVEAYLFKHLFSEQRKNAFLTRPHRLQETGSCYIQSVLSWLESRIGETKFNQFMAHMAEKSIAQHNEYMDKRLHKAMLKAIVGADSDDRFRKVWNPVLEAANRSLKSNGTKAYLRPNSRVTSRHLD